MSPAMLDGDALPTVFTLADIKQQVQGNEQAAMDLALRWLESGQVRQVAPPRPVFIRFSGGVAPPEADLCLALRRAFPSLVMVGGSALWRHGCSRQQDNLPHFAVVEAADQCPLPVRLHRRPASWLEAVSRAAGLRGECHGVPMLSPEMAVADAATFADVWVPDRDQLDWQHLSASGVAEALKAMAAFSRSSPGH